MASAPQITKKKKAVLDGVFKAELNNFLMKELAEDGYSGVEVRRTPARAEVIIMATRTQSVLGERGRRIKELTSVVQKRFGFEEGSVELYAEKVSNRGLCAVAQCESLRYKLVGGLAVRRACYGVIVSGKLRGQRAKAMKFVDGLMIHSGHPVNDYIQQAVRHVQLRQGVIGIKVKIMLPHDPRGQMGPKNALPDQVQILEPQPETNPTEPSSEHKVEKKEMGLPIVPPPMQPVERVMSDGQQVPNQNQGGAPSHLIAALIHGRVPRNKQIQQGGGGPIRVQLQQGRGPPIVPYPQGGQPAPQQLRTVQQVYQQPSNGPPQQRIVHQIAQRPMPQPMMRVSSTPQPAMQIVHTGPPPQPQQIL
ncbi:ribosomal protein S3 [Ostertagia ostertagi]